LISHLERVFGKLKTEMDTFEHVGIVHEQDVDTKEVYIHQQQYVKQLRPISVDETLFDSPDEPAPPHLASAYLTLLGGAAWMTLTVPACCVYVSYLQRHSKNPTNKHLRDLNRLVRWLKRTPQGIRYKRLEPPLRLVVVSDSSFSAGDYEGLVMRGCMIMIVDNSFGTDSPGGKVQLLDWYARKQPHVCRSTFAAELHAALDAINQGMVIQAVLTELKVGTMSAAVLAKMQTEGKFAIDLEVCVDAKSVFDAVSADKIAMPNDKHLMVHCLKFREFLDGGLLKVAWWIDTVDMLSDGLTKGFVDRSALITLTETGVWQLKGVAPVRWPRQA
jgi:hypothetical protein